MSWTALLSAIGVTGLLSAFAMWLAVRRGRSQGAAEQAEKDLALAKEAEEKIHEIQSENRDTKKTKKRLDDGDF